MNEMKAFLKKCLLLMSVLSLILSFFGCSKNPDKLSRPEEKLSSISITESNMDRTHCYSFWARQSEDGYLLDADCIIVNNNYDDFKEINLDSVKITDEDFQQFLELDREFDFYSLMEEKSKKNDNFFVCDETTKGFSVKYGETSVSIETNGECYSAVYECFSKLAQKYADTKSE